MKFNPVFELASEITMYVVSSTVNQKTTLLCSLPCNKMSTTYFHSCKISELW